MRCVALLHVAAASIRRVKKITRSFSGNICPTTENQKIKFNTPIAWSYLRKSANYYLVISIFNIGLLSATIYWIFCISLENTFLGNFAIALQRYDQSPQKFARYCWACLWSARPLKISISKIKDDGPSIRWRDPFCIITEYRDFSISKMAGSFFWLRLCTARHFTYLHF